MHPARRSSSSPRLTFEDVLTSARCLREERSALGEREDPHSGITDAVKSLLDRRERSIGLSIGQSMLLQTASDALTMCAHSFMPDVIVRSTQCHTRKGQGDSGQAQRGIKMRRCSHSLVGPRRVVRAVSVDQTLTALAETVGRAHVERVNVDQTFTRNNSRPLCRSRTTLRHTRRAVLLSHSGEVGTLMTRHGKIGNGTQRRTI